MLYCLPYCAVSATKNQFRASKYKIRFLRDNILAAVEGGHVQGCHVVLPPLVEVTLSGDKILDSCYIIALYRLDDIHSQLIGHNSTSQRRNEKCPI